MNNQKIQRITFLTLFFLPSLLLAQSYRNRPEVSFGPKLGYTFGKDGGFTWGIEFTFFPQVTSFDQTIRYGITLDYTAWGEDNVSFHLGAELISNDVLGADIGPSLVIRKNRTSLGVSGILFTGFLVYPYFEVLVFDGTSLQSIGGYIKVPVFNPNNTYSLKFN